MYAPLEKTEKAQFHASFDRCMETCESDILFINFFYSKLRSSNSGIAAILGTLPLNYCIQILRHSIYLFLELSEGRKTNDELVDVANAFRREAIEPFMLDLWLESLLLAVAEYDHEFSSELLDIWRRVMMPGIDLLKIQLEVTPREEQPVLPNN